MRKPRDDFIPATRFSACGGVDREPRSCGLRPLPAVLWSWSNQKSEAKPRKSAQIAYVRRHSLNEMPGREEQAITSGVWELTECQ